MENRAESRVSRQVFGSNPFYLISACCMLGGCLALTNSLSWVSIPLWRLLMLILTLNIYEIALLGLAWFLIRRRGLMRDGGTLLILEAIFLADVTFLNSEISTVNLRWGVAINAILFTAAAVKLAVALRLLGMQRISREFTLLLITLGISFGIPVLFTWIGQANVSPMRFYLMWWIAGALLGGYAIFWRWTGPEGARWPLPLVVYSAVPLLSLFAHIGILQYVYDLPFWGAYSAPLLLGLTLLLNRVAATKFTSRRDLIILRLLLPVAALVVSANDPSVLCVHLGRLGRTITPTQLAVIAGYLTYVYCFFSRQWMWMVTVGAVAGAMDIFGPPREKVESYLVSAGTTWTNGMWKLIPKTVTQWGYIAVGASFAFLGIGAAVSLRRRPSEPTLGLPEDLGGPPPLPAESLNGADSGLN